MSGAMEWRSPTVKLSRPARAAASAWARTIFVASRECSGLNTVPIEMPTLMPDLVRPTEPQWHIRRGVFHGRSPRLLEGWLSARERSREPERWQDGVLEARHGADPFAGQGEHVEAHAVADATRRA